MSWWSNLKSAVAAVVRNNDNQEITGDALQGVLNSIIDNVGQHATFAGTAFPGTVPESNPDGPIFYIASGHGNYSNFGINMPDDGFFLFVWDGTEWIVKTVRNFLAYSSVHTGNIATSAIEERHFMGGVVSARVIRNGAVTTPKIADGAVTTPKIADSAVTLEKLDPEVYSGLAHIDGYYETMGVGTATNLKGQNTVDAEFTYRKSGGNVEVADGNAMIEAIKGNTIAWNQLVPSIEEKPQNQYFSPIHDGTFSCVNGHKYYIKIYVKSNAADNARFVIGTATAFGSSACVVTSPTTDYKAYSYIREFSGNTGSNNALKLSSAYSGTLTFKCCQVIDLTLIYGAGKEPATVEQFEQDYFNWFGKPLTYEPYDAGSLRNAKISGLKTVGFNLWDEEWEVGGIDDTTGQYDDTSDYQRRSKNFISVIGNVDYFFKATRNLWAYAYDSNYNYIGRIISANHNNIENEVHTTPSNARFVKIKYNSLANDICINLSDPNRNGEYEPYKESTLPLDVTTLTGKLNGEGSSVVVFADGMRENDEIRIEGDVVKAYKRGTIVDMGDDLLFTYRGDNIFETGSASRIFKDNGNVISTKFIQRDTYANYLVNNEMTTKLTFNNNDLCFKDTAHTGADLVSGKATWLSGTKLYLELAEPEVYVLDDFNLPKLYPVANGGTEEQLSNSPNSLPATLSIRYGLNAAAFIQNAPKNYISKESMNNFLSNLGSAMGGTWSMVWNSSTNKYDFSFTQNRSVGPVTDDSNNNVEPDNNR